MKLSTVLFATATCLPVLVLAVNGIQGTVAPTNGESALPLAELVRSFDNGPLFLDPGEPEDFVNEDRAFLTRSADELNATDSEDRGITEADGVGQLLDEDGLPIYH